MRKASPKAFRAFLPVPKDEWDEPGLDSDRVDPEVLRKVCEGLSKGQVGILPTETVYGLFGSALSDTVVDRIYEIKGRDRAKYLPVQVEKYSQVPGLGVQIHASAEFLAKNFWPGPLTLVLPYLGAAHCAAPIASKILAQWGESKTVAVRIPDHPFTQMVLARMGQPLIATSANASGSQPLVRINQLDAALRGRVDWIVDGGTTMFKDESTIVRCDREGWQILREGALKGAVIQRAMTQAGRR